MTLKVHPVDVQYIARVWPKIEGFLAKGLEHTDDFNLEQIKVYLSTGTWLLLVATDDNNEIHGAMTVSFSSGPNDRTAVLTALGGKHVVNLEVFGQVCSILRTLGATRIQAYARDSAVRLYERVGMNKKATLTEIRI